MNASEFCLHFERNLERKKGEKLKIEFQFCNVVSR